MTDRAGRYAEILSQLSNAAGRLADSLDDDVLHDVGRLAQLTLACQVYLAENLKAGQKYARPDLRGFGMRLRAAREAKQWTQQALASRLGVTRALISLWETERNLPEVERLFRLVELLQLDAHYLLTGIRRPEPSPEVLELVARLVNVRLSDNQRWVAITALLAEPAVRTPNDAGYRH